MSKKPRLAVLAVLLAVITVPVVAQGLYGTRFGDDALLSATGIQNSAFGYHAARSTTTGESNTAVGFNALANNTTGSLNSAFGVVSLYNNTTGIYNVGFGPDTLFANTTGSFNVAVAYDALHNNTVGSANTSIGYVSMLNSVDGVENVAIGFGAGGPLASFAGNVNGDQNVWIGNQAGPNGGNFNNAIAIGHQVRVTASNQVRIGNQNITDNFFNGTVHVDEICIGATCINEGQLQQLLALIE